jgi:hypothetical protein
MSVVGGDSPERQAMVARVKNILLKPKAEWPVIDAELATVQGLFTGYACLLAAIPVVATLIGGQVFGHGAFGVVYRPPLIGAIVGAVVSYVLSLVMVFVLALIIDALAPSFDGTKNRLQALKVAIYANTAGWVAGVFMLLPALSILGVLGGLYSLYLLYLGLPVLMKAPQAKALGYTVVTIIVAIVLSIAVGAVTAAVGGLAFLGGGATGFNVGSAVSGGTVGGKVSVPGVGSVDLGKLEAASKQMEASAQQMQAQVSGQMVQGAVQSVGGEALQALLPASLAGYARGDVSSSSGGAAGMSVSEAEGEYSKGDQRITLQLTDMGGAAGLAAMAGAFSVQSSKTTSTGYEKVGNVGGRMTTEEWDSASKNGKYAVMVGQRFMVSADGHGASMDELKVAVASVNQAALENLAH